MPLDPRIQRLERAAAGGDWGIQVALESELMRSRRAARNNAARDAALHESKSAGAYYAAMLLDALREAEDDGWWPVAGDPRPEPSTREDRALLVEPNDLLIERVGMPSPKDRNEINLILPDQLGHPLLHFHDVVPPYPYTVRDQHGDIVQLEMPAHLPESCARSTRRPTGVPRRCVGHVFGGIRLTVRAIYGRGGIMRRAVKIESGFGGPYFLAQASSSYTPRPLKAHWSNAEFLYRAEEDYCLAYERLRRVMPSYQVLLRFEALRDAWAASEGGGDEVRTRQIRQEFYVRVTDSAGARELAQLPDLPYYRGLLTPAEAEGWHQLLGEFEEILAI